MKTKTSELSGIALDYAVAVAKCDFSLPFDAERYTEHYFDNHYSWDWALAGPIIERERLCLHIGHDGVWFACTRQNYDDEAEHMVAANTPLEAAMRCYVASKLGLEVEIPEELT